MMDETETLESISEDVNETLEYKSWKNVPKLSDLKQDLTDAKADHSTQVGKVDTWLNNLNISGNAVVKSKDGFSSIVPKLIRKQAEWRYASLSEPFLSTDDIFNTEPVTFEDRSAAIQNGLVLNNQFNTKIAKVRFIDEYVRTAVDEGTVIVRVGWNYEDKEVEVTVPDFKYVPSSDPTVLTKYQELSKFAEQDPQGFLKQVPKEVQTAIQMSAEAGYPIEVIPDGSHIEIETKVIKNHPTVEVCDYNNIIFDPTCLGDITKANFIIYSFETNLSDLEKDSKYFNLDNIDANTNSPLGEPDYYPSEDTSFSFKDKPRKKFVAHEYWGFWDIDGTGIVKPIVATWVGNTLIRMEENPFPDQELPFITVQYLPVRKAIYGEPDGVLLEDNQKIIGAVTRGMIDIIGRSANGQQGTRKDALDVANKRKFDMGMDYEFNPSVDPNQAFHMHKFPEIPQSAQLMIQMQNSEAESLTGVKAFSSGISGEALGSTATGIRSALDATSKRELGILRRLAEGVKQIGRKIISMNSEFLSEEEVIRITNEEFVTVRRDDLAGDIDITLNISTAEADEQKAKELAFMLQTIGPSEDPAIRKMILSDISKLRKMPTLAKKIETYEPQPNPLAEERAMLENALLKAQIAKENSMATENIANAELYNARAGLETERAKNTSSDTDLKDLNFIEQESSTKHERDLDKIQTQGLVKAQTNVVDNLVKQQETSNTPQSLNNI